MKFPYIDLWEERYFSNYDHLVVSPIPCSDDFAYSHYPSRFNWVYNKLALYEAQGLDAVPHGVPFDISPAFSKPIMNLYGLSIGARVIHNWDDIEDYRAGHLLMPVIHGDQYTTDVVVAGGCIKWSCSMKCNKDQNGSFADFEVEILPAADWDAIRSFIEVHFNSFTGVLNFETIGDTIIECHLRMSPQYASLYGDKWMESMIHLYHTNQWNGAPTPTEGISVILRTEKEPVVDWNKCDIEELEYQSSSFIMICGRPNTQFTKTIGDGFTTRIAIVNSPTRTAGEMVKEILWDTLRLSN